MAACGYPSRSAPSLRASTVPAIRPIRGKSRPYGLSCRWAYGSSCSSYWYLFALNRARSARHKQHAQVDFRRGTCESRFARGDLGTSQIFHGRVGRKVGPFALWRPVGLSSIVLLRCAARNVVTALLPFSTDLRIIQIPNAIGTHFVILSVDKQIREWHILGYG